MKLPERGTEEFIKFLEERLIRNGVRHSNYDKTVKYYEKMAVHIEGKLPTDILERKRPNEDEEVKKYRLESWEPITLASSNRAISIIRRALNPKVYALTFKERPSSIPEEYALDKYLVEDFPKHRSLMNFIRKTFLPSTLADPNALMITEPRRYDISQNEWFSPVVSIYPCMNVLDYESDQWYLVTEANDDKFERSRLITETYIMHITRTKDGLAFEREYNHDFGFCPVHFTGGILKGKKEPYYNVSFMDGVLPHWNKVISLATEYDAGIVTSLFMEAWEIDFAENDNIEDTIRELETRNQETELKKTPAALLRYAKTMSEEASSSLKTIKINRDALNPDQNFPNPPKDYIKKPIEILQLMKDILKEEEEKGFKAINLDVINQIGADQSGIAKAYDRTELDNYLLMISEHIFDDVLPNIILHISAWLYGEVLDEKRLEDYLPDITKPQSFDVVTLDFLTEELKTSENLPGSYRQELAGEIVEKRFNTDETKKKRLKVAIDLDPLFGMTDNSITIGSMNGVITQKDMYLHYYIKDLVNEIAEEDKQFLEDDYKTKKEKLYNKVDERLKANEPNLIPTPEPGQPDDDA